MNQIEENKYSLIAYGRYLELIQITEDTVKLSCQEEEYNLIWKDYFDMCYDYDAIVQRLQNGADDFLKEAAEYGKGIRILQQEPFEAMISFIISQNKNIPAIKNCIEAICRRYGERRSSVECGGIDYYTFPTPEVLAMAGKDELHELKTGYRDEYIIKAAQAVSEGVVVFDELKKCSYEEVRKSLKSIHGIGEKVANCISLYGLHHIEVFPIDVWIAKVLNEIYQDDFHQELYEGYAGIIQQYMFYYMRYLKGNKKK
jgi:N-glycosylase/DNA lyase